MRAPHRVEIYAAAAVVCLLAGCTWVRPVHVSPEVSEAEARPSGTPRETLDHFDQMYPQGTWASEPPRMRVAVGPICLSREAVIQLTGEAPDEIHAEAAAGTSRAIVTVRSGERDLFFYIARTSQEVQAIIMEQLVNDSRFQVFALEGDACSAVLGGDVSYEAMNNDGIRYFIDGSVVVTGEVDAPTRVYLRMIDTAARGVAYAASAEDGALTLAARSAATELAQRVR